MSTLLATVTAFCQRQAVPIPTTVFGSTDTQIVQIMALLQEGLEALSERGAWERLTREATWTTLAAESQGTVASIATNGFRYLLPRTLWDRTNKLPLVGPMDAENWQALKAMVITGPRYSFRIRGGNFMVTPAPTAGWTWAFEYVSENFLLDNDGTTYKSTFAEDTDEILLPKQIVLADLRWRWKKEKGLTYAEDFNSCEEMVVNALGRDGGKPVLYLDDCHASPMPGIFVPAGSWSL